MPFPRDQNTCTRVPAIVALQVSSGTPQVLVSKSGAFEDASTIYIDLTEDGADAKVGEAIQKTQSEIIADVSESIADRPIHIRYIRSNGPVMTLIDLPGITHVDVNDDSFDIHAATANMVNRYISNDNMIILVVIPATDDFGNAEALQMVKKSDGGESRCIGVLTKCDLVPEEDDTGILSKIRMVRDTDVKLELGFVAVRNRAHLEMECSPDELERIVSSGGTVARSRTWSRAARRTWRTAPR